MSSMEKVVQGTRYLDTSQRLLLLVPFSWFSGFVLGSGYLGLFVVSIIGSATILFIFPSDAIILASGGFLNPILAGIIAGVGSAIGELSAYYVGRAGRKIVDIKRKKKKEFSKTERMFHKYGFWTIPVFSFTPLPMDIIGLFCGGIKYNVKKFFIGVLIGKIPRTLILTIAGGYAIPWILKLAKIFGVD